MKVGLSTKQEQILAVNDVREIWFFVRRNAKFVGLVMFGTVALAIVLALILPPHYAATAVIMLDPRKTNMTGVQSVVSEMPVDNPAVRSEIDIIQSRAVIDRVIDQMDLMNNVNFNPSLTGARWVVRLFASAKPEDKEMQASQDRGAIAANILSHSKFKTMAVLSALTYATTITIPFLQ